MKDPRNWTRLAVIAILLIVPFWFDNPAQGETPPGQKTQLKLRNDTPSDVGFDFSIGGVKTRFSVSAKKTATVRFNAPQQGNAITITIYQPNGKGLTYSVSANSEYTLKPNGNQIILRKTVPTTVRPKPAKPSVPKTNVNSLTGAKLGLALEKFCRNRLGQKVNNGECAMLAVEALRSVGCKTSSELGPTGRNVDYKWGTPVTKFSEVRPGDIIQLRDLKFEGRTSTGGKYWKTYRHHTAIVSANLGGGKLKVLEQNVGRSGATEAQKRRVQENTYDFRDKKSGKVWIYHPVKK